MADAALFVGFGQPARPREPQALEAYIGSGLGAQLALYREQVAEQLSA